jgi:hypothetical protein
MCNSRMEVVEESYWQERMAASPAFIAIWSHFQELSPDTRVLVEGLRWVVIQV